MRRLRSPRDGTEPAFEHSHALWEALQGDRQRGDGQRPDLLGVVRGSIKGQDALIEQIKTHTQFPEAWAEYTGKQATRFPRIYREEKEWQAGRFSQQTIDDLFNCFFGEAE